MESKAKLIVGLGNPGRQYDGTRHNLGFLLVSKVAEQHGIDFRFEAKFEAKIAELIIGCHRCFLLMPQTFMNLSGRAISKCLQYYKSTPENVIVVHDELDFVLGDFGIKFSGGANGHNGVQSIIDYLGSRNFWRVRLGIGRPILREEITNYVLSSPSAAESQLINELIAKIIPSVSDLVMNLDRRCK